MIVFRSKRLVLKIPIFRDETLHTLLCVCVHMHTQIYTHTHCTISHDISILISVATKPLVSD